MPHMITLFPVVLMEQGSLSGRFSHGQKVNRSRYYPLTVVAFSVYFHV